ncbi:MAG TPA: hypothetical protein VLU47_12485 [Blastocatellia bacterium]|nr:hypothetical protein [Blastocatellia bacterium]
MNDLRMVLEVANWEFKRFFKIKDFIVSVIVLAFIAGAVWGVTWLLWGKAERPRLATINAGLLSLEASPDSGFEFLISQSDEESGLRESVGRGELDGLLIIKSIDEAELVILREALWQARF